VTVRHFRIKAGLKPGELAAAARIGYSAIDNIENERKNASVEVIYRIADALKVPAAALVRDPACLLGKDAGTVQAVSA
jgi:transcriptional regulator with XRE-family HTH domain